jgi:hypothetical protein
MVDDKIKLSYASNNMAIKKKLDPLNKAQKALEKTVLDIQSQHSALKISSMELTKHMDLLAPNGAMR